MEAGEMDGRDCRVEASSNPDGAQRRVLVRRKPDETHRCHLVQEGLPEQGDGSPDHVSLLLPGGGGWKLRQLPAHSQDGVLSVGPRLGICTGHLTDGRGKKQTKDGKKWLGSTKEIRQLQVIMQGVCTIFVNLVRF